MDLSFRFDLWWARLSPSPRDRGRVAGLVRRPSPGQRERPQTLELELGRGVVGDHHGERAAARPGMEVALMNVHVLASLAGGDPERMALAGDNLWVDLDLSEANLPVGARLLFDQVELEISPVLHRPCAKFVERFGAAAAKKVARAGRRGLRGRGVLCTVLRAGTIRLGEELRVAR